MEVQQTLPDVAELVVFQFAAQPARVQGRHDVQAGNTVPVRQQLPDRMRSAKTGVAGYEDRVFPDVGRLAVASVSLMLQSAPTSVTRVLLPTVPLAGRQRNIRRAHGTTTRPRPGAGPGDGEVEDDDAADPEGAVLPTLVTGVRTADDLISGAGVLDKAAYSHQPQMVVVGVFRYNRGDVGSA